MARTLEVHPLALAEAEDAVAWYSARDARLGPALADEIERCITSVLAEPLAFPTYLEGRTTLDAMDSPRLAPSIPVYCRL